MKPVRKSKYGRDRELSSYSKFYGSRKDYYRSPELTTDPYWSSGIVSSSNNNNQEPNEIENLIFRSLRCSQETGLSQLGAMQNSEMEQHINHTLDEAQFKRLHPGHLKRLDGEIDFAKMSKNPRNW